MQIYTFLTVLVSAFLLLLIQPMLAKLLLPMVGGAPSVWIASMLFFQTILLAGYGYAALTTAYISPKKQWGLHLAIFTVAIAVAIPLSLKMPEFQATNQPVSWVLLTLLFTIGLPYFVLSASSSLLQRWYHASTGCEPYFLFSASNAGSFLGLFAYPLLLEWMLGLEQQLLFFSYGFILLLALFAGLSLWMRSVDSRHNTEVRSSALGAKDAITAIILAFLPSALFLALTLYLTTDIGSFPMIWVIPLALYLLSFVIAFASWGKKLIHYAQKIHPLVIPVFFLLFFSNNPIVIFAHFFLFFIVALSCHGRLANSRPSADKLTAFFFWVSVGGALGGLFNVMMPMLSNDAYEYIYLMVFSVLALPAKHSLADGIKIIMKKPKAVIGYMIAMVVLLITIWGNVDSTNNGDDPILHKSRNFYGVSVVRKKEFGELHINEYSHGTTIHGLQATDPERALDITSYYTPIAEFINTLPDSYFNNPFAIIGLGAGTSACYGRKDQKLDFYEIDRDVIAIAQDPNLFTYLQDCPPDINIIEGDGRIMLGKQPNEIGYNLLVVDGFTSDAIPMHLLTLEAVKIYTQKMADKTGIIAFNVSNRFYNLQPFLSKIANELSWDSYRKSFKVEDDKLQLNSEWLLIVPKNSTWKAQIEQFGFKQIEAKEDIPLWTDDYSHILPAIRIRR